MANPSVPAGQRCAPDTTARRATMAYVVAARWTAKANHEDEVLDAIKALAFVSRSESGCQLYELHRDPDDPRVFFFYERFDAEADFQRHAASDHFKREAVERAFPLLESRERFFYETLEF
jgi:quinol monooxygenase YgiN